MKIVTGLFHSDSEVKQALSALDKHSFNCKEGVTLIAPSKVSANEAIDEQAASTLKVNLIRLGISTQKAPLYARRLKRGSKLIIIKAKDERALEALNLLYEAGAAESGYRALIRQGG